MPVLKISWKNSKLFFSVLTIVLLLSNTFAVAEPKSEGDLDLGSEYSDYNKQKGSGKSSGSSSKDRNIIVSTLLFVPNRILDLLDIIRFDVGVGPAVGAVVRVTPHAQAGARFLMPISLRAGLRGRKMPVFIEHTTEMGAGPLFLSSKDREPSPAEVGIGADLFIAGAYLGISFDSIVDFFGGFAGFDISDDDL